MNGPQIILLGLMGAGKTSVGRELSRRLQIPFTDLDHLIEQQQGRRIPEIFAADGEQAFREIEHAALDCALQECPGVLALGGGAAMDPRSQTLLAGHPVVWLDVDERTARRRIGHGRGRPMLTGPDPMARWRELAAQRDPVHRKLARWRVDAGHGAASAVARAIIETMGRSTAPTQKHSADHRPEPNSDPTTGLRITPSHEEETS